jgi:HAD superfamily hydrolase (TIGR01509 family)
VITEHWSPRPDLVIFDCDGVLIDSELVQRRIDAELFTMFGYPVTAEELVREFAGRTTADVRQHIERTLGWNFPADFGEQRMRRVDEAYRKEVKTTAGIREVLVELDIPFCVASNARTFRLRHVLELTGLLPFFEPNVFGADLVDRPKPAPDLFLLAARRIGVSPPRCLVIEDSVPGVNAAIAAGMRAIGFYGGAHCFKGHEQQLVAAGASAVFNNMNDLKRLIADR